MPVVGRYSVLSCVNSRLRCQSAPDFASPVWATPGMSRLALEHVLEDRPAHELV
jgi:hypothetical protein